MRPLGDRVLVEMESAETESAGGIALPDISREKSRRGLIAAVGPGLVLENGRQAEPQLSVGERVLVALHAGTEIEIDGAEYLIVREGDVLATLDA